MKRRLALAAVALILTGCSSGEDTPDFESDFGKEDKVQAEPAPEPEPEPLDEGIGEQAYVAALQSEYPAEFGPASDASLIDLGYSICGAFDTGMTFVEAVEIAVDAGYTYPVAGYLIGASIGGLCMEHEGVIP